MARLASGDLPALCHSLTYGYQPASNGFTDNGFTNDGFANDGETPCST